MHNIQAKFGACAAVVLFAWSAQTASSAPPQERGAQNARGARDAAAPAAAANAPGGGAPTDAVSSGSPAIATFQGGHITVADMQAAIANKDLGTRARIAESGGRQAFLEQLVRYDLLVREAERRGYGYHPAVIEAGKRAAITQMIERDLSVEPSSISASDVETHYQANLAKYGRPLLRRASHIEVATEAEAKALITELKTASRDRFSKVAGERSRDERTRRQGGELGYFDREGRLGGKRDIGAIPSELAQAAFAQKRGVGLSPRPIARPDGGFSVLMLTGEMPAVEPRLADVEAPIREEIAKQRLLDAQTALLQKLKDEWKPELHPERMNAVQLDATPPLDQPHGFPAAPPDPRAPPRFIEPDGY